MGGEPVVELLRAIRGDIADLQGGMVEVKERPGILGAQYSSLSRRVGRVDGDVERIERRLDIAGPPALP